MICIKAIQFNSLYVEEFAITHSCKASVVANILDDRLTNTNFTREEEKKVEVELT